MLRGWQQLLRARPAPQPTGLVDTLQCNPPSPRVSELQPTPSGGPDPLLDIAELRLQLAAVTAERDSLARALAASRHQVAAYQDHVLLSHLQHPVRLFS